MARHKLIVIGFLGQKRCYLDVEREEACQRYAAAEGNDPRDAATAQTYSLTVEEISFDDEFGAYDVWSGPL